MKKMNIKDTELYQKHGIKGVKRQLFTRFLLVFIALLMILYDTFFVKQVPLYSKIIVLLVVLPTLAYYLYYTIVFIRFIRAENINNTKRDNKEY